MATSSEFIKSIRSVDYAKYSNVSSREKLVVYAISFLEENEIPLTFNNICIATFKLFPDKFYFSEEFKEYPHIEMLNRTILHLRPKERNYATGSVRQNYALTNVGKEIAKQVELEIARGQHQAPAAKKVMDSHKKTNVNDLNKIKNSTIFKSWNESGEIDAMEIWSFFDVTPFTRLPEIRQNISTTKKYAKDTEDAQAVKFLEQLEKMIP